MDNVDAVIGKVLSRRVAFKLFGIASATAATELIGARVAERTG